MKRVGLVKGLRCRASGSEEVVLRTREEAEAAMPKRRAPESNKDAQRQRKRREGRLWTDVGVRKKLRERLWEREA